MDQPEFDREVQLEQLRYDAQVKIEKYKNGLRHATDFQLQAESALFASVIDSGKTTLRAAFILNGAAAIAVLSFLASAANNISTEANGSKDVMTLVTPMISVVWFFAIGALLAVIGSGTTYLAQLAATELFRHQVRKIESDKGARTGIKRKIRRTQRMFAGINAVSILVALGSMGMFFWGIGRSAAVFGYLPFG